MKVREGGRIVNVACLLAVSVNGDGHRQILGLDVATTENGAGWLAFFRSLIARGLSGTQLVISDDHIGLIGAIEITLAGAGWQRCRTHYLKNLLTKVPRSAETMTATMVRTIFAQPNPRPGVGPAPPCHRASPPGRTRRRCGIISIRQLQRS